MEIFSSREKSISPADPTSHLPEPVVDCSVMILMGEQSFSTDGEAGREEQNVTGLCLHNISLNAKSCSPSLVSLINLDPSLQSIQQEFG